MAARARPSVLASAAAVAVAAFAPCANAQQGDGTRVQIATHVFKPDKLLAVPPGDTRDEAVQAMAGHVIAQGEIVGTFQQMQVPLK